jgi:hypothetical protein
LPLTDKPILLKLNTPPRQPATLLLEWLNRLGGSVERADSAFIGFLLALAVITIVVGILVPYS